MAYGKGSLILASDYNNFIDGSGLFNSVWNVGKGSIGYGQGNVAPVSTSGVVTATQWATLINNLNAVSVHQSGTSSGISATTSGSLITYLTTLETKLASVYTNSLNTASSGTVITGTEDALGWSTANSTSPQLRTWEKTVTFATADQARYFFNAGGRLLFNIYTGTNNNATARTQDLVNLINSFGTNTFAAVYNTGRSGSGYNQTVYNNYGYYNNGGWITWLAGHPGTALPDTALLLLTSGVSPYNNDYINFSVGSDGVAGSNGDYGRVLRFRFTVYSGPQSTFPSPPTWGGVGTSPVVNLTTQDAIDLSLKIRLDVAPPESTNITNSWGTVSVGAATITA